MDNNSTNRPRLGSAILDPLLDNITNNTSNSILSSSWLPLATSSKDEDEFNAYNTLNTGIQSFRHPSENNRPFSPLTTKILSLIQQKPWQSWDTYKINNGTSSPRYISNEEMMETSGYHPSEETPPPPEITAGIHGEGSKLLKGTINLNRPNYTTGVEVEDNNGNKNFALKCNKNTRTSDNKSSNIGIHGQVGTEKKPKFSVGVNGTINF
ncbi:hypothetical protein [Zymomonas sp.]|uniref:hypothetical protein n=1 Tax=Zymomonas sp. TaxID=2068624 RepID=UPI0025F71959|nr:hypothetical protein [Zymomonas sp.]MCA1956266.1 hypothetical protein [Zymomonas sp.]